MTEGIIVALLALVGTCIGSIAGILTANRLTVYRIEQLERKVDKHNCVVERMAITETNVKTAFKRIDEIKEELLNEH